VGCEEGCGGFKRDLAQAGEGVHIQRPIKGMKYCQPKRKTPWIRALANVRTLGTREGFRFDHVQTIDARHRSVCRDSLECRPRRRRTATLTQASGVLRKSRLTPAAFSIFWCPAAPVGWPKYAMRPPSASGQPWSPRLRLFQLGRRSQQHYHDKDQLNSFPLDGAGAARFNRKAG
jgi:hypothetical protein